MEDFEEGQGSRFDWVLLTLVLLLVGLGMLNIHSATHNHGEVDYLGRQTLALIFALCAGLGIILLDYRIFERIAYFLYGANLFALALVPFLGVVRNGAKRWIELGFFNWQPSETMKMMVILALAKFFQGRNQVEKMGLKELLIPALIVAVPALMTISQPDLGTGGHILIIGSAMLLFVGIRTRILVGACIIGIVSFPIFWQYGLKPYQKERIVTVINPMRDPRGEGYNAIQSLIAVGSGEWTGKGFQRGTQTQLEFTPEGHTDFIFTVLAEEWGFLGAMLLFALYVALFYRMIGVAAIASDTFGALLGVGIASLFASQIFINIAMVCGLFPIVGIPLPLLSYGGTSLLTSVIGLALLMNVGYRRSIF